MAGERPSKSPALPALPALLTTIGQAEEDAYFQIRDPAVVTVLRGRPRGSGPFASNESTEPISSLGPARGPNRLTTSVRRNPSQWELDGDDIQEVGSMPPSSAPARVSGPRHRPARGGVRKTTSRPAATARAAATAIAASTALSSATTASSAATGIPASTVSTAEAREASAAASSAATVAAAAAGRLSFVVDLTK